LFQSLIPKRRIGLLLGVAQERDRMTLPPLRKSGAASVALLILLAFPAAAQLPHTVNVAPLTPTACFTLSPSWPGHPYAIDTAFFFDASCSHDGDGKPASDALGLGGLTYRWDLDSDGTWETGPTASPFASQQYLRHGWVDIDLEVTNGFGMTSFTSRTVYLNDPPVACFTYSPSSGSATTVFSFSAACSTDTSTPVGSMVADWDWDNDGDFDAVSWGNVVRTHSFGACGTFTVRLEMTDLDDYDDRVGETTRTITTCGGAVPPTACFTFTTSQQSVTANAACSANGSGTINSWQWDWGDGYGGSGQTASHTYTDCGTVHGVRLTVQDSFGQTGTTWQNVFNSAPNSDADQLNDCLEAFEGTDPFNPDTDGDGLNDYIESTWYPQRNAVFCGGGSGCFADWPDPLQKDMYLEVDYMAGPGHNHRIDPNVYASMELLYRDHGIRLHVDTGDMGGGYTALPEVANANLDDIYYSYFTNPADFNPNRIGIFRYQVVGHLDRSSDLNDCGVGWVPGEVSLIYHQSYLPGGTCGTVTATRMEQVAIHEFGHNVFGVIDPASDRWGPSSDCSDMCHDKYTGYAMTPTSSDATNYHPNRWSEMASEGLDNGMSDHPDNWGASGGQRMAAQQPHEATLRGA
jgi:PKD repeat protein